MPPTAIGLVFCMGNRFYSVRAYFGVDRPVISAGRLSACCRQGHIPAGKGCCREDDATEHGKNCKMGMVQNLE